MTNSLNEQYDFYLYHKYFLENNIDRFDGNIYFQTVSERLSK